MNDNKTFDKLRQMLSLTVCVLMILAVSLVRDGRFLGHEVYSTSVSESETLADSAESDVQNSVRTEDDGTMVVNTTELGRDIIGYAGPVPLDIYIKDGAIVSVKALDNQETPEFFEEASEILSSWDGKTLDQALQSEVDAVSGATFSSRAIIDNVRRGVLFARQSSEKESIWSKFDDSPKAIAGLIAALMAAILPLFIKNKTYRLLQLMLNVAVLGFWCGTFISYSSLIGYMSNGMNIIRLMVPAVLLVTAFIYPLFGKKSYYCTNVCPFGSLQELVGRSVKYKVKIRPATIKKLDTFRRVLWAVLMICLWTGLWFDWVDYEPFSAFVIQSASWIVITIAVVFVLLSAIVTRPYCRFVCPTGSIMKFSQKSRHTI